jgi:hypothetical protein
MSWAVLSVILLYPLILLGDGCLLIAVAVASTTKGRSWLWGLSFAVFHALYGVIGVLFVSEATQYSQVLGEVFMVGGALYLLWHFLHHRFHHRMVGDCSCENHPPAIVSPLATISSAAALSLHSFAGGAIIRSWIPESSQQQLVILIIIASAMVGALTFAIVAVGELEQKPIMSLLDKLPGIVATILTGICFFALFHLLSELITVPSWGALVFLFVGVCISFFTGYSVHDRRASNLVSIGSKSSHSGRR